MKAVTFAWQWNLSKLFNTFFQFKAKGILCKILSGSSTSFFLDIVRWERIGMRWSVRTFHCYENYYCYQVSPFHVSLVLFYYLVAIIHRISSDCLVYSRIWIQICIQRFLMKNILMENFWHFWLEIHKIHQILQFRIRLNDKNQFKWSINACQNLNIDLISL